MKSQTAYQSIIDSLYGMYSDKGFVTEDTVLDALEKVNTPLSNLEYVCDQLLSMGVIICDDPAAYTDENGNEHQDYARSNYEQIFDEILSIDDSLAPLIRHIRQLKPPQHGEWRYLMPQAQGGNGFAYRRIIEMYLRTVLKVALSYHKRFKMPLADTIQECCVGLIVAVDKYDIGRNGVFATYFPWWVRQNVMREMPFSINPAIHFPSYVKEKLFSIWETVSSYQVNEQDVAGIQPELVSAMADTLGCSTADAEQYSLYFEEFHSLEQLLDDQPLIFSDNGLFEDNLVEVCVQKELKSVIGQILDTLSPRERQVLQLRFGLTDCVEQTLEQVAGILGVTRERIRQIEVKAIKKLRHQKRSGRLKPFLHESQVDVSQ